MIATVDLYTLVMLPAIANYRTSAHRQLIIADVANALITCTDEMPGYVQYLLNLLSSEYYINNCKFILATCVSKFLYAYCEFGGFQVSVFFHHIICGLFSVLCIVAITGTANGELPVK